MPCRLDRPLKPVVVRVETTVIVLVCTLSIDDVELVSISSMHIFEEIETGGNGSPVGKPYRQDKFSANTTSTTLPL